MEDCTLNGSGVVFNHPDQTCFSMDVSAVCADESADVAMSMCVSAEGSVEYLVDVDGDTYRVSGSYMDGNGELVITGANGTFTCTYTDGEGSCVDDDGEELSF